MRTYTCFLEDDRYSVPTLVFIDAPSDEHAALLARNELHESPFRKGFELVQDERIVEVATR